MLATVAHVNFLIGTSGLYLWLPALARYGPDVPGEVGKRERKEIIEFVIFSHPFTARCL